MEVGWWEFNCPCWGERFVSAPISFVSLGECLTGKVPHQLGLEGTLVMGAMTGTPSRCTAGLWWASCVPG